MLPETAASPSPTDKVHLWLYLRMWPEISGIPLVLFWTTHFSKLFSKVSRLVLMEMKKQFIPKGPMQFTSSKGRRR